MASTAFNIKGEAYRTVDAKGTATEQTLDAAGRRTLVVEERHRPPNAKLPSGPPGPNAPVGGGVGALAVFTGFFFLAG